MGRGVKPFSHPGTRIMHPVRDEVGDEVRRKVLDRNLDKASGRVPLNTRRKASGKTSDNILDKVPDRVVYSSGRKACDEVLDKVGHKAIRKTADKRCDKGCEEAGGNHSPRDPPVGFQGLASAKGRVSGVLSYIAVRNNMNRRR